MQHGDPFRAEPRRRSRCSRNLASGPQRFHRLTAPQPAGRLIPTSRAVYSTPCWIEAKRLIWHIFSQDFPYDSVQTDGPNTVSCATRCLPSAVFTVIFAGRDEPPPRAIILSTSGLG